MEVVLHFPCPMQGEWHDDGYILELELSDKLEDLPGVGIGRWI